MKKIRLIGLIIIPLLLLLSCAGYHSKQYNETELDKSQIAIITTDDQFVTIGGLDGKKIDMFTVSNFTSGLLWGGRFPRTISVLPGAHSICPCYQNPFETGCADAWIDIETEAGQSYLIKHERADENKKSIRFWIEKQAGTERTLHQKLLNK